MGKKISSKVSEGLGAAIQEAKEKLNTEDNVEELLNSGIEVHKKRHRRTKAEIEAAKQNSKVQVQDNSLFEELNVTNSEEQQEEDNRPEWEKRSAKDHEEFCEWELQKAKLNNKENPDFDFRDIYAKGQTIYFIRILNGCIQSKELKTLVIRTIYPRFMVCNEGKLGCQCIGYKEKDLVFDSQLAAKTVYETINLKDEKDAESSKLKRNSSNDIDEYYDEENDEIDAYMSSEEEE